MVKIKILAGSVRPSRFNTQPANWILDIAQSQKNIQAELLDLEKINLPFLDEPVPPSQNKYSKDHTFAWSKTINEADGFIFVTPEYNHSYSPALKNAIDYLFFEWHYKPLTFISYGSLAGGSRAVEHLRAVVAELKMYDLRPQIMLPNYWENLDDKGNYKFTKQHEEEGQNMLKELAFWAEEMKTSREKLNAKN